MLRSLDVLACCFESLTAGLAGVAGVADATCSTAVPGSVSVAGISADVAFSTSKVGSGGVTGLAGMDGTAASAGADGIAASASTTGVSGAGVAGADWLAGMARTACTAGSAGSPVAAEMVCLACFAGSADWAGTDSFSHLELLSFSVWASDGLIHDFTSSRIESITSATSWLSTMSFKAMFDVSATVAM